MTNMSKSQSEEPKVQRCQRQTKLPERFQDYEMSSFRTNQRRGSLPDEATLSRYSSAEEKDSLPLAERASIHNADTDEEENESRRDSEKDIEDADEEERERTEVGVLRSSDGRSTSPPTSDDQGNEGLAAALAREEEERFRMIQADLKERKMREEMEIRIQRRTLALEIQYQEELEQERKSLKPMEEKLQQLGDNSTNRSVSSRTHSWVQSTLTPHTPKHKNHRIKITDTTSPNAISLDRQVKNYVHDSDGHVIPRDNSRFGGSRRVDTSGQGRVVGPDTGLGYQGGRTKSSNFYEEPQYSGNEQTQRPDLQRGATFDSGIPIRYNEEFQTSSDEHVNTAQMYPSRERAVSDKRPNASETVSTHITPDFAGNGVGNPSATFQPYVTPDIPGEVDRYKMLELRVAKDVCPFPRFESGKVQDFLDFREGWAETAAVLSGQSERRKYRVLLEQLGGHPRRRAQEHSGSNSAYRDAWKDLDDFYGSTRAVYVDLIEPLRHMKPFHMEDYTSLREFGYSLTEIMRARKHCPGMELHVKSDTVLGATVAEKLPEPRRRELFRYARSLGLCVKSQLCLEHIAKWWQRERDEMAHDHSAPTTHNPNNKKGDGTTAKKRPKGEASKNSTGIYTTTFTDNASNNDHSGKAAEKAEAKGTGRAHWKKCLYCERDGHNYSQCLRFLRSSLEEKIKWFKAKNRCPKCAAPHSVSECRVNRNCARCSHKHFNALHDILTKLASEKAVKLYSTKFKSTRPAERTRDVLLKVVRAIIHGPLGSEECHILLDDGAERSLLTHSVAERLGIRGTPEVLKVETVARQPFVWPGQKVSFSISPIDQPDVKYVVANAYSSTEVCLHDSFVNLAQLQRDWPHLQGLPGLSDGEIRPALMISSDNVDLISPLKYRLGPPGAPRGIQTLLGWSIQGNCSAFSQQVNSKTLAKDFNLKCLNTTVTPISMGGLHHMVERLWKLESLVSVSEKEASRSKMDKRALSKLEQGTDRERVNGIFRYRTPLLWVREDVKLYSQPKAALPRLRSFERKCLKEPKNAEAFGAEITKLLDAGHVRKLTPEEISQPCDRQWYIPSHVVWTHDKARLVFDCSFEHEGVSVNGYLQPGPTLCSSLLGVILRFRQYPIALSADVKAMFHQVRLRPEDRSAFRFLWRHMHTDVMPDVYEWQVLPFGATCSPCCASFALLKHTKEHGTLPEQKAIEEAVYVDNLLASYPDTETAREAIQSIISTGAQAGFEWRKIASNTSEALVDIPEDLLSSNTQLSLDLDSASQEPALGLRWDREEDNLVIAVRYQERRKHTKRTVLQDLASYSFDPPGFLSPFTVRAKVVMQDLWKLKLDWDDEIPEGTLKDRWLAWRDELKEVSEITVPRCYTPPHIDCETAERDLHIFCDAAERMYGAVGYLVVKDGISKTISFVMARSRVAPKRQLSMPRLELSAAVVGAQLAHVLCQELKFEISQVHLWSDSTNVLSWLKSESQRFKVFVGTRVAEIQNLTDGFSWHYVNSEQNVADDLTRGKQLSELVENDRWFRGPAFLRENEDAWPKAPSTVEQVPQEECKATVFLGHTSATHAPDLQVTENENWCDFVTRSWRETSGDPDAEPSADQRQETEIILFRKIQEDSYGAELAALKADKQISKDSKLWQLAPELDPQTHIIRVGGRLRRAEGLDEDTKRPIILEGHHPITQLLVKDFDEKLHHAFGPERVFAEIRRRFHIPSGRQIVRSIKFKCVECRKQRAKPSVPRMADLPMSRMRIHQSPFYSTGVDCFGPMEVKIGRRHEKRWGILFKCMTTKAVHLDLLESLDSDAFLLAYNRFYPRKGVPYEILCDCGTNFKGAETEIRTALAKLEPDLQRRLALHKVRFRFNPPNAPHFGGTWEREIKSVKATLNAVLKSQTVPEPVLRTLLVETEGILNSKPLGYVSSDAADIDPITPNVLLMGRRDPVSPPVVYEEGEKFSRRRWRHSQVLADQFWARFVRYYLPMLQSRPKWQQEVRNLKAGDVVMIADPQSTRAHWPVGRVAEVLPGNDGRIRVVRVMVGDKLYTRPVARIILLKEYSENSSDQQATSGT